MQNHYFSPNNEYGIRITECSKITDTDYRVGYGQHPWCVKCEEIISNNREVLFALVLPASGQISGQQ
jgi:hypothetical protein